jgi:hypothetical protein
VLPQSPDGLDLPLPPVVPSAAHDNPFLSSFDSLTLESIVSQRSIFFCVVGIVAAFPGHRVEAQSPRLQPAPGFSSIIQRTAARDRLVPIAPPISPISRSSPTYTGPTAREPTVTATAVAALGAPTFDPYSSGRDAASSRPALFGAQPPLSQNGAVAPWGTPGNVAPQTYPGLDVTSPVYPQQPPVLFPNGAPALFPGGFDYPGGWPQAEPGPYMQLFQDVHFTYTWVAGGKGSNELITNDVELGTTVNFPNFLYSAQPLHVSPTFVFHFLDGPTTGPAFPTTLPSRVFSTYVGAAWQPMLTPMFGGDIDVNVGIFSDFGKLSSDSVRVQGTAVFVLAMTPTLAVKGGVNYLDRVDIKMLPAVGFLWTPNPQTRFDVFFPKPKLAQYLTTIGNTDVWWYLNGEYGGGSWTVSRTPPSNDDRRVDINDIRVGGGIEWTSYTGVRGFVETAYVFDRELVFASAVGPASQSLKDSIMVRGGLAY